jgi:hypothetical protein
MFTMKGMDSDLIFYQFNRLREERGGSQPS